MANRQSEMGHMFCRLNGHGCVVLPRPEFRAERVGDGVLLAVEGRSWALNPSALLATREVPPEAAAVATEVSYAGRRGDWLIETSIYRCGWPEGVHLSYTPHWPGFEFLGPHGEFIYLQGPVSGPKLPHLEAAVAPGQELIGVGDIQGIPWIDVSYVHEGSRWRQRLFRVPFQGDSFILVTGQAIETRANAAAAAAAHVASTIGPTPR